jgi:hypothetical protein
VAAGFAPDEDAHVAGSQRGPRRWELVQIIARLHRGRLIRHGYSGNDGNGPRDPGQSRRLHRLRTAPRKEKTHAVCW